MQDEVLNLFQEFYIAIFCNFFFSHATFYCTFYQV